MAYPVSIKRHQHVNSMIDENGRPYVGGPEIA